jgi:hypothetical protein
MRFFPTLLTATTTVAAVAAVAPVVAAAPAAPARAEISTSVEVVSVDHPFKFVPTDSMPEGQLAVIREGVDGARRRAVAVTEIDGAKQRQLVLWTRTVRKPVSEVVAVGTADPTPPLAEPAIAAAPAEDYSVWDQLAQCESGGDWSINTGNGYYGGLQFSAGTWSSMGGSGLPSENSREEQIRIAIALRDQNGGYGAWPACSAELGLPR